MELTLDTPVREAIDVERLYKAQGLDLDNDTREPWWKRPLDIGTVTLGDYLHQQRTIFRDETYLQDVSSSQMVQGLLEMGILPLQAYLANENTNVPDTQLLSLLYAINRLNFPQESIASSKGDFYRDPTLKHTRLITHESCAGHVSYTTSDNGELIISPDFGHFGLFVASRPSLPSHEVLERYFAHSHDVEKSRGELTRFNQSANLDRRLNTARFLLECSNAGLDIRPIRANYVDVVPFTLPPGAEPARGHAPAPKIVCQSRDRVGIYLDAIRDYWSRVITATNATAQKLGREDIHVDPALIEIIVGFETIAHKGIQIPINRGHGHSEDGEEHRNNHGDDPSGKHKKEGPGHY
ncbi:hypothetical protein HYV86_07035 [Candidatus Woesearchaeota archaeon]|nr:hypothetical protein [Candidatus Woesearchaeota archaeon]